MQDITITSEYHYILQAIESNAAVTTASVINRSLHITYPVKDLKIKFRELMLNGLLWVGKARGKGKLEFELVGSYIEMTGAESNMTFKLIGSGDI